jgi:autotransporter translocation and assembly factor TamB
MLLQKNQPTSTPFAVVATIPSQPIAPFAHIAGWGSAELSPRITGSIAASLQAQGTLNQPYFSLDFSVNDVTLNKKLLGDVLLRAEYRANELQGKITASQDGKGKLAGQFFVDGQRQLRATLQSQALQLAFLQDVAPAIGEIDGQLSIKANAEGPLKNPILQGEIRIIQGRYRPFGFPAIEQISLRLRMNQQLLKLEHLAAQIGRGKVTATGQSSFQGISPKRFSVELNTDDVELDVGAIKKAVLSSKFNITGNLQENDLEIRVVSKEGVLQAPDLSLGGRQLYPLDKPDHVVFLEQEKWKGPEETNSLLAPPQTDTDQRIKLGINIDRSLFAETK